MGESKLPGDGCLLEDLGPILEELVDPFIGQRVIEEHIQNLKRLSRKIFTVAATPDSFSV
jgi:hypothetical protein